MSWPVARRQPCPDERVVPFVLAFIVGIGAKFLERKMTDNRSDRGDDELYIPPYANVRLIECRDFIALVPVCAYREFFAYGKKKAREVTVDPDDPKSEPFWDDCTEDEEVWAVVQWIQYEDGRKEAATTAHLRAPATEDDAREAMRQMMGFYAYSKEELLRLADCLADGPAKDDALAYVENRFPNYQSPPTGPNSTAAHDLYQARLKVLAGLQPKTVELIRRADAAKEPGERQKLEREAVQAYFAELANEWTEEQVLAWQRNNPIGTAWMCEFGQVMKEPERGIDPINHELAFNWLRRKYNLLTAEELSDAILVATGQRVASATLKKRRERLGLTTERRTGPRPNSETESID